MKTLDSSNLTETERRCVEEAAAALKAKLPVSRVVLFGSKARGDAQADSDVDLLVLTAGPVTMELRHSVSDLLFDIGLQDDMVLSSIVVCENDWTDGLIRHMLIHKEVERDGCEV